jgi:hypothetical protein
VSQATENVAFEERTRSRAVILAVLGAVVPLAGFIVRAVAIKDIPDVSIDQLVFIDKHSTGLIISGVLIGLGALAEGGALYYLFRAVKGRRPALQPVALYAVYGGAIGTFVSTIVVQVALGHVASSWVADHPDLVDNISARDALRGGGLQALQGVGLAAQLSLGFAFVIISLNAMRLGLLTRFVGIMGIAAGVFLVIPVLSPLPIVQSFWLIAVAYLMSGRWPSGVPEAWTSGEARPWPSQQELREERERRLEAAGGDEEAEAPLAADEEPAEVPAAHPVSKKRKRKRRR